MLIAKKLDGQDTLHTSAELQKILDAGRRIHAAIDTIDALFADRLGVNRNDLRCLHLLEQHPATPGEIAAHTRLTSGSVTALVDRLEACGMVERCRSVADRRSVAIAMTEGRLAEMRALIAEIEAVVRVEYGGFSLAELAVASAALDQFIAVLGRIADRLDPAAPAD
jgi:DNA-binding MarR family transcriptional regulator